MGSGIEGYGKAGLLFVAYNDIYYGIYPLLDPANAGSWYSYGDGKLAQGRDATKDLLLSNEALAAEIEAKVREALKSQKDN